MAKEKNSAYRLYELHLLRIFYFSLASKILSIQRNDVEYLYYYPYHDINCKIYSFKGYLVIVISSL